MMRKSPETALPAITLTQLVNQQSPIEGVPALTVAIAYTPSQQLERLEKVATATGITYKTHLLAARREFVSVHQEELDNPGAHAQAVSAEERDQEWSAIATSIEATVYAAGPDDQEHLRRVVSQRNAAGSRLYWTGLGGGALAAAGVLYAALHPILNILQPPEPAPVERIQLNTTPVYNAEDDSTALGITFNSAHHADAAEFTEEDAAEETKDAQDSSQKILDDLATLGITEIDTLTVTTSVSDENISEPHAGLGQDSTVNQEFAGEQNKRATSLFQEFATTRGIIVNTVVPRSEESKLEENTIAAFAAAAAEEQLTLEDFILRYEDNDIESFSSKSKELLENFLDGARNVTYSVKIKGNHTIHKDTNLQHATPEVRLTESPLLIVIAATSATVLSAAAGVVAGSLARRFGANTLMRRRAQRAVHRAKAQTRKANTKK